MTNLWIAVIAEKLPFASQNPFFPLFKDQVSSEIELGSCSPWWLIKPWSLYVFPHYNLIIFFSGTKGHLPHTWQTMPWKKFKPNSGAYSYLHTYSSMLVVSTLHTYICM
jgi:hypothetical protein